MADQPEGPKLLAQLQQDPTAQKELLRRLIEQRLQQDPKAREALDVIRKAERTALWAVLDEIFAEVWRNELVATDVAHFAETGRVDVIVNPGTVAASTTVYAPTIIAQPRPTAKYATPRASPHPDLLFAVRMIYYAIATGFFGGAVAVGAVPEAAGALLVILGGIRDDLAR